MVEATRDALRAGSGRGFVIAKTDGTLSRPVVRVGDESYPLGETEEDALLVVAVSPKAKVLLTACRQHRPGRNVQDVNERITP